MCCKPGTNPRAGLQVHHIFPFHYCIALGRPDLELDDRNLITLCEDEAGKPGQNHHLLVGHLDDFESSNLAVVRMRRGAFYGMDAEAIKSDMTWLRKKVSRLPVGAGSEGGVSIREEPTSRFPREVPPAPFWSAKPE
jgi:hypothetical protein